MIAGMTPVLKDGRFQFVTCTAENAATQAALTAQALALFHEDEGVSLVVPSTAARAAGVLDGPDMAQITLNVYSDLEGIGLTAAVAEALAARGIPANVIAAFHHDHVFVPHARGAEALEILQRLQAEAAAKTS
ncbi:MAG: ACT domain-containing protein [Rhodobacteraceae bacterium]|nr:ACT domain-containing protein [Paracoccaceae bacterium]